MDQSDLFPRLMADPVTIGDDRGCIRILYENDSVVLKRSSSSRGVFRGLHRQVAPHLQDKIIRVISGKIIDFVTNPDDPDDPIHYSLVTPEDDWVHIAAHLAHGFYALDDVVFEYFCDGGYNEDAEESHFAAPAIKAALGIEVIHLSEKDRNGIPMYRRVVPAPGSANARE